MCVWAARRLITVCGKIVRHLGEGDVPDATSIARALRLVRTGVVLWLLIALVLAIAIRGAAYA